MRERKWMKNIFNILNDGDDIIDIYVGRRPCKTDHQATTCQCEIPPNDKIAGCGEDCLNR